MVGYLVSSKVGHDKDNLYVIVKEDEQYYWLSDGRRRKQENPKKKKKKHVQLIKVSIDEEIQNDLIRGKDVPDHVLYTFIKAYNKHQSIE